MEITHINHKGFISALSQDAPSIILFRNKTDEHLKKSKAIHKIIAKLEDIPPVYFYELIIDDSEENKTLCEITEVPNGLSMVLYKNGCFNRYKQNPTTETAIKSLCNAAKNRPQKVFSSQKRESSSDYTPLDV